MQARHALFLSTLFLSAAALAGEPPVPPAPPADAGFHHHHPTPEQMVRHMDQRADLKLSDVQRQQMQSVLQDQQAKMRALHEEGQARLAKILTPEQQTRFDKSRDDMRQRRADRMERHGDRMKARADALKAGDVAAPVPVAPQ